MKESLRDRRRLGCALALGLCYAAFTVLGREMQAGGFASPWWKLAALLGLYTAGFSTAAWFGMGLFKPRAAREAGREAWLSRLLGSPIAVFLLLAACWIPVWLAFWPGTFSADSLTQFETYYNEQPYAHHPLLHTALLGFCMTKGIELHPDGCATYGVALYCGVQLALLSACIAYGCWWLRRRGAPVWARALVVALFALCPFYAPWAFCPQKDVLFGALVLVFCLQLTDLWRCGLKPLRAVAFGVIALLMMLLRNNGVYALALLIPFAVLWARKGARVRMALLLVGCAALYIGINNAAIAALEAERGSRVEILSIPLQQMARTLREHPEAIELDEEGTLETLYGETNPADIYHPQIADPVKWAVEYDLLDENLPALLSLWARMGISNPESYAEAFLIQNLPYYLPYSEMLYRFDFTVHEPEWFPIEQTSYFPSIRKAYEEYDEGLSFLGIPGTRLLSETAFAVWLCLFGFAGAAYTRQGGFLSAFGFLLAIWVTCLLGPVAIMRYLLGLFYAVPVLLCAMLSPGRRAC